MGGVGGEARHGVGRGDGGDFVDLNEWNRCQEGAGGWTVAEGGEKTSCGVHSGAGVASEDVEIDRRVGCAGVIAGDGEIAMGPRS